MVNLYYQIFVILSLIGLISEIHFLNFLVKCHSEELDLNSNLKLGPFVETRAAICISTH